MQANRLWRAMKIYFILYLWNTKFLSVMIFYFVYLFQVLSPYRAMARNLGYQINYGLFANLLSDVQVKLILFVGVSIIFSNLPFNDSIQIGIVQSLGKRGWYISQMCYVLVTSVVLNILFFGAFLLNVGSYLSIANGWGALLRELSREGNTLIAQYPSLRYISAETLSFYSPDQAFIITFGMAILVTIIIGLIIILGNRLISNGGMLVTYLFIFINLFIPRSLGSLPYFLSPITWLSLVHTAYHEQSYLPTHQYTYLVSILLIVCLVLINLGLSHKKSEIHIAKR